MRHISTTVGAVTLGVVAAAGIIITGAFLSEQNLSPTPQVTGQHEGGYNAEPCRVSESCPGPTLRIKDPEGERVTYRFYDQLTKQPVGKTITANTDKPVTPTFTFVQPGEKRLYMVVQDDAGHAAPDYPIIISVVK